MRSTVRALLASAFVLATLAVSAAGASAVSIAPNGPIDAQAIALQTFWVQSTDQMYACRWRLQGAIPVNQIQLGNALVQIGRIGAATITCNDPNVIVTPLVSPPGMAPGPWPIGLIPNSGVLGLPQPTGMLVTVLAVRLRVVDNNTGFRCLFTGRLGLLIRNGANPQVTLLTSQFFATPVAGDTCPVNLVMYKFGGNYNMFPPLVIGP